MNGHAEGVVSQNFNACPLFVEVCRKKHSTAKREAIVPLVRQFVQQQKTVDRRKRYVNFDNPTLASDIAFISFADDEKTSSQTINVEDYAGFKVLLYTAYEFGPVHEELDDNDESETVAASSHWQLPCVELDGLWESLYFDMGIKTKLLNYAATTMLFSDKHIDPTIITWNRVVLLHGPPGTGKTSLCKALAQKLCIRYSDRYSYGQLIEINSHSLFSKWFSESGKLVMKLFQKIQELIDDPKAIIFVLIDEVESLTAARKAAFAGSEPSDAIRVVNALLTQIDQIKRRPNVLILTTSNMTCGIDSAFIDRADIKQYLGPPSVYAIYQIYVSCIRELVKKRVISAAVSVLDDLAEADVFRVEEQLGQCTTNKHSNQLMSISRLSHGLSGRSVRKMPFLAHAAFIWKSSVTLDEYLTALDAAVRQYLNDSEALKEDSL